MCEAVVPHDRNDFLRRTSRFQLPVYTRSMLLFSWEFLSLSDFPDFSFLQQARRWRIADSAPSTPCTINSSSLGTRRRLGYDATNGYDVVRRKPVCDDAMEKLAVTISTGLHNSQLRANTASSISITT